MRDTSFIEDMGQVMASLMSNLFSSRRHLREEAKQRLGLLLQDMGMVTRDDFDALHAMLQTAREEQAALAHRLSAIEAVLGLAPAAARKPKQKVKGKKIPTQKNRGKKAR